MTLAAYAPIWLQAVHGTVKKPTYDQYESLTRNHLVHHLGALRLSRISPPDVRAVLDKMAAEGYASRTRRGVVDCLRMLLRRALQDGIIDRNVAELVDKPLLEQKEPRHFTAAQARRFLEANRGDDLFSLFAVALGTGLRRGELLALSWRDADLETRTLVIRAMSRRAWPGITPPWALSSSGKRWIGSGGLSGE